MSFILFILTFYVLPSILCIFAGAKQNRIDGCESTPMPLCFIPFVNISVLAITIITIFFGSDIFDKFKNWYRGS